MVFFDTAGIHEEILGYFRILKKGLSCQKHITLCQKAFKTKTGTNLFKGPWDQITSYSDLNEWNVKILRDLFGEFLVF